MSSKNKKSSYVDETAVAVKIIDTFRILATDPLWSSMLAWWWLQTKSGLGWDDRQLLKVGIVDIGKARSGLDHSIALDLLDRASGMMKGAGTLLLATKNPAAGAAAAALDITQASYKSKPSQEQVAAAFKVLGDAGMIQ